MHFVLMCLAFLWLRVTYRHVVQCLISDNTNLAFLRRAPDTHPRAKTATTISKQDDATLDALSERHEAVVLTAPSCRRGKTY